MGVGAPGGRVDRVGGLARRCESMAMTIWNEMAELERQTDELFRGLSWPRAFWSGPRRGYGRLFPTADVFRRDGDLVVRAELPGIDPEKDVKVTFAEGELVISGERKSKTEVKEEDYYRMESSYGHFERHIPVPEGVDESKIKAVYKDGILEVVVQGASKAAPAPQPVPIKVQSSK